MYSVAAPQFLLYNAIIARKSGAVRRFFVLIYYFFLNIAAIPTTAPKSTPATGQIIHVLFHSPLQKLHAR